MTVAGLSASRITHWVISGLTVFPFFASRMSWQSHQALAGLTFMKCPIAHSGSSCWLHSLQRLRAHEVLTPFRKKEIKGGGSRDPVAGSSQKKLRKPAHPVPDPMFLAAGSMPCTKTILIAIAVLQFGKVNLVVGVLVELARQLLDLFSRQ